MKRVILGTCILLLAGALIFLLLPVASREHRIEFDRGKIEAKQDYLEQITRTDPLHPGG
jgi:hypothetical protein